MTGFARTPRGFTIVELFAVVFLITILVMLLLPAVQSAREMARRTSCANNLTQVTMAMHNYSSAFGQLPVQLSGTDGSPNKGQDNDKRLSVFVGLLPFLGNEKVLDWISRPMPQRLRDRGDYFTAIETSDFKRKDSAKKQKMWVAGGPEPFTSTYDPWVMEVMTLRCPSDPGIGRPAQGRTNYAICLGDGVLAADSGPFKEKKGKFLYDDGLARQTEAAMRGVLVPRTITRLSDVTDGLSNTIILGEIATDLGDSDTRTHPAAGPGAAVLRDAPTWARDTGLINVERPRFWDNTGTLKKLNTGLGLRRGFRWADGMPLYTGMNTILAPNREITLRDDRDDCWGILPPSSRHQGGAHIALAGGEVRFVTESIDAGDSNEPTVYDGSSNPPGSDSPYGVWGALGTRAMGELAAHRVDWTENE